MKKTGRSHAHDEVMGPELDNRTPDDRSSQASQDPSGAGNASAFPILGSVLAALRSLDWANADVRHAAIEEFGQFLSNSDYVQEMREIAAQFTVPTFLFSIRRDMTAGIPIEITSHVTWRGKQP